MYGGDINVWELLKCVGLLTWVSYSHMEKCTGRLFACGGGELICGGDIYMCKNMQRLLTRVKNVCGNCVQKVCENVCEKHVQIICEQRAVTIHTWGKTHVWRRRGTKVKFFTPYCFEFVYSTHTSRND